MHLEDNNEKTVIVTARVPEGLHGNCLIKNATERTSFQALIVDFLKRWSAGDEPTPKRVQAAPAYDPANREVHSKLEAILASRDGDAITAVIEAFFNRPKPARGVRRRAG